jgi:hypothetical protein
MSRIDINGILTSYEVIEAVYPAIEIVETKEKATDAVFKKSTVVKYYIRFKSGVENVISEEEYKAIRASWTN